MAIHKTHDPIFKGNRAVVIHDQDGYVSANLFINTRNGMDDATISRQRFEGKTLAGAKRWAGRMLAEA